MTIEGEHSHKYYAEWVLAAAVVLPLVASAPAAESYSYGDLVGRLTDLERLAVLPEKGETCAQWSSWDRASRYDATNKVYVAWSANGDGGGMIRQTNNVQVMAEMDGPGCLWRIWSAQAWTGRVSIIIDGQATPAVDLPFMDYFTGTNAPFTYPMLVYDLDTMGSSGLNIYMPIPYQKSCRIVAESEWGNYYQFVYTTFPKGTKVPTFSAQLAADHGEGLSRADAFLREKLGSDPAGPRPGEETLHQTLRLEPGREQTVEVKGPRAITAIRMVRPKMADREDEMAAMRQVALRITFDGAAEPQVWCPLGDFFGTAPGWNEYRTLATGMTKTNAYAFWYMPFASDAKVALINEGLSARDIELEIVHAPLTRPFKTMGHFHCKWHRDTFEVSKDRHPDWSVLRTEGRGRFLGFMLHVWNPQGGWWGEGDEKFFVDGEPFPSTFGTGSEDYFGYAWCHPGLFQRPFHAQSMSQNNDGHQSVLRWQIADNIPFQSAFDGYIEKYFDKPTEYAATVCWYLAPGGKDPYGPVAVTNRHGHYIEVAGGFTLLGCPPGYVRTQPMDGFGKGKWDNEDQLWWVPERPGNKLDIALPVEKAGTYRLAGVLTKAGDYGIVQLYLDGVKLGEPIDLFNESVEPTALAAPGTHTLTAGEHVLTVEVVGINEKAGKRYMFGLDTLKLELVK